MPINDKLKFFKLLILERVWLNLMTFQIDLMTTKSSHLLKEFCWCFFIKHFHRLFKHPKIFFRTNCNDSNSTNKFFPIKNIL